MKVEIGPGHEPLQGYVAVSAVPAAGVDYLIEWGYDPLPFEDGEVSEIVASHVIEHVPWFRCSAALADAARVLRKGGSITVRTLDARRIVSDALGGKYHENVGPRGCTAWGGMLGRAFARLFSYPVNPEDSRDHNWHRAAYCPESITQAMEHAGLEAVLLPPMEKDPHGPYSFGVRGVKA